ncbi:MAG: hypothetical protein WDW38_010954 [Sanguina aurantia]
MSGALRSAGSKLVTNVFRASGSASEATSCFPGQQFRFIGGDKIGEFWGRPSSYTEGTAFLGTPKEHLEMIKRRPLSPDVIGIDNKSLHYKLPWGAISSIANRGTGTVLSFAAAASFEAGSSLAGQQLRFLGGDKVKEYYGRPSPYTEGTGFLGTPKDYLERTKSRPLSPDVIELDNKSLHYKFPWGGISSIANRATGTVLSVGFAAAAYLTMFHDLPSVVTAVSTANPIFLFPLKFFLSYTIIYHWAGGVRHLIWDKHKIGNMAKADSLLEVPAVELSSKVILGGSAVVAFLLAFLQY